MNRKNTYPYRVLAVDDNPNALEIISRNLEEAGYETTTCASVQNAVEILADRPIDLVVTDLKMPRRDGMDLIRHVSENFNDIGVVMITGYPSIDGAVEAIKLGAEEFLAKPFTEEELLSTVRKVVDKLAVRREARAAADAEQVGGMLGASRAMKKVFKLIEKAASMPVNVLISGESGTGKELVARAIHYGSARSSAPFVPVNCAAIPESLLESELFGHEKGAFTGANASRAGFFQIAEGGTVFLDEIGDASPGLQAKLLRVIQNKEIIKVGSTRTIDVNACIVAATNKDLKALVDKGLFREDLYYRLDVVDIPIPPLRERKEDVPPLLHHFAADFCREMGCELITFSDRALRALADYSWPGNVRELENLIQKLVVTVDEGTVEISDLPEPMRFRIDGEKGLNRSLAQVEREHIHNVLASVGGNKTRAAGILKIDRKTLREKLKKA